MHRIRILAAVSVATLLAGCQTTGTVQQNAGGAYVGLQHAEVVLERDILVPAGQARVFVQGGEPVSAAGLSGAFDSYRPHCAFEIGSVDHGGRPISAGVFKVVRVEPTIVPVVSAAPLQVAWSGGFVGGGSQSYYDGYHFWLTSDTDRDVRRMTCYGVYAEPYELYPPTIGDINAALGTVARLKYR
ncbi:MAG: hypothetical protein KDI88_03000 [Gammaproteobacteria bacterium]|nr:hypothetical protein [Gammaproteobacteria bacterium]